MRPRSTNADHEAAVARRLATLSAELTAVRGEPPRHTQIRAADGLDRQEVPDTYVPGVAQPAEPPVLPVPGRHSARPRNTSPSIGRVPLTRSHLAVMATLAVVAVAVAGWFAWSSRSQPVGESVAVGGPPPAGQSEIRSDQAVVELSAESTGPSGSADPSSAGTSTTGELTNTGAGEVTVDVAGKVRRPGIAVLPAGSRVVDALKAAGGARPRVSTSSLNLARVLVDGEQILVGVPTPPGAAAVVGTSPDPTTALVNLNSADATSLDTLPGVGPVTAAAILSWRETNGAFTSVEELLEVDGIGDKTLAEIAPHVTI